MNAIRDCFEAFTCTSRMNTTPISIPEDLANQLAHAAKSQGVSVEQFVSKSLDAAVRRLQPRDPLFEDNAVFSDDVPEDLSADHDRYLYGDAS